MHGDTIKYAMAKLLNIDNTWSVKLICTGRIYVAFALFMSAVFLYCRVKMPPKTLGKIYQILTDLKIVAAGKRTRLRQNSYISHYTFNFLLQYLVKYKNMQNCVI